MALTAETGTGANPAADTYATVTELRDYAAKRGVEVPQDVSDCEALLVKAMDFIEAQESRFKGARLKYNQPLSWPRYGVVLNGYDLQTDTIPGQLKHAQAALAIEAQTQDLMPTRLPGEAGAVTSEKVGPLQVDYAEPVNGSGVPRFAKAEGLLAPLFAGGGMSAKVVRA